MRDLKILIILIVVIGFTYYGIEPYAHSIMNPAVANANYDVELEDKQLANTNVENAKIEFENSKKEVEKSANLLQKIEKKGKENEIKEAKKALDAAKANLKSAENTLESAKNTQDKYTLFWDDINKIDLSKGDATQGADLFMGACYSCHGLKSAGLESVSDANTSSEAYGVNPPDLSSAGYLYSDKFLAAIIKNPAMATKVDHKFGEERMHPMIPFTAMEDESKEISSIVAYLKSVAPKNMENSAVFEDACQRCHDLRYDKRKMTSLPNFVKDYMGSFPPDLSTMIKSRGADYLHKFINDPQKMLPGTAMPRTGLNEKAETQVIDYLYEVGDGNKANREKTALYIMLYFVILSVFAWLFKRQVWSKLH